MEKNLNRFIDEWDLQENAHTFRVNDDPFIHIQMLEKRYEMENAILLAVSNANFAQIEEIISAGESLPKRQNDDIRDMKDYYIAFNALLRKAAEHAGVHPVYIDNMSNYNVLRIEKTSSVDECHNLILEIIRDYCMLVDRHCLKSYSAPIQRIIAYIGSDLTANLSLNVLADIAHVNASYLSALFSKEVGMPLTEYVANQRIELAKYYLRKTDLPAKTISLRCGFSDLNYFIRQFKKYTGVTPKYYKTHPESRII